MYIAIALILFYLLGCTCGVSGTLLYYIYNNGEIPFMDKYYEQSKKSYSFYDEDRNEY